jgi:hypothetical protein
MIEIGKRDGDDDNQIQRNAGLVMGWEAPATRDKKARDYRFRSIRTVSSRKTIVCGDTGTQILSGGGLPR